LRICYREPPGNRFEKLRGDRAGQYSIRINDQWRVCFEWPDGSPEPFNIEIVDDHDEMLARCDAFRLLSFVAIACTLAT
jgi:proteic killer suppression protein